MDRLHLMKVFVAVAEEEGFAAAARRLEMSPPAVTRAIAELEETLKVKLLNRTTRFVRTTDAGHRYLEDAKHILEQVKVANEAVTGISTQPQGRLAITAPVMFGRMYVTPIIVEYLKEYPGTQVDAIFLDRIVNLIEEGIDLGVRIGNLPDSSMRALKVGHVRQVVCASTQYLKENGIPQKPNDLKKHTIISPRTGSYTQDWRFEFENRVETIKVQPRLTVTNNNAAITALKENFGICRLLSYQISPELKNNKVKIILENYEPTPLPIHIVHREGRFQSKKVRVLIDLLAERLRNTSTLN